MNKNDEGENEYTLSLDRKHRRSCTDDKTSKICFVLVKQKIACSINKFSGTGFDIERVCIILLCFFLVLLYSDFAQPLNTVLVTCNLHDIFRKLFIGKLILTN